ncbi:MAG: hypothetical protein DMF19_03175 [Verrucomicrobia bacterium]|nr:MAG: hypothetical protein DMF19_03175 [Verrucomicrobiota bacterium]
MQAALFRWMVSRSPISIFIAVLAFAIASCGGRPKETDAKAEFLHPYPTAGVVSVRMSEDEVVARSFAITYRHAGDPLSKTLELQYMKNDQGIYELRPAAPSELP